MKCFKHGTTSVCIFFKVHFGFWVENGLTEEEAENGKQERTLQQYSMQKIIRFILKWGHWRELDKI